VSMNNLALLLACLTCAAAGKRVQASTKRSAFSPAAAFHARTHSPMGKPRRAGGLASASSRPEVYSGRNHHAPVMSDESKPLFRNGVDLTGKVAFLCGASSEKGFGWAIAKELAQAGATILFGTWPMGLTIFQRNWKKASMDDAKRLPDGSLMEVEKVYPLDAVYDDPSQVPEEVANNKRYKSLDGFTIQEVVDKVKADYGHIDILVHALANGPEVTKPLLETSREGYLAASSASAYSLVSMVSRFGPIMRPGGSVVSISYIASTKVIPGYGGGMSSAKAQLESDTRTLAFEAGRKYGIRVNTICAGPMASRAATAISAGSKDDKPFIMRAIEYSQANAPLTTPLVAEHVGKSAMFLLTDMAAGVTGVTLPVDMGLHAMGHAIDSPAFEGAKLGA